MPQFPISDSQGIIDGLNYVLSGPGSLGQNFQGYSSNTPLSLSGDIFDPNTGQIVNSLPIATGFLQYYLTDCQNRIGVSGGTDRVVLSGQINNAFTFTTPEYCDLQYTVAINRYVAQQNRNLNYNDYLFYFEETVASHVYNYNLDTNTGGLVAVTSAGVKPAFAAPATGSLVYPVDFVAVGVNAATGTGNAANIAVKMAYGAAGNYNDDNTQVTVNFPGDNWTVGSTIVIPGTSVAGGATPANDLTLTATTVSAGSTVPITQETIFTNIIDQPALGYYLYVLELQWYALTGSITIDSSNLEVRSLSAQVVKQ